MLRRYIEWFRAPMQAEASDADVTNADTHTEPFANTMQKADAIEAGVSFSTGSFVRYKPGGPRRALWGCLGRVVDQSNKGAALDWVRAEISGRVEEYAPSELEQCSYWAFGSHHNAKWRGPFSRWTDASAAVDDMMLETVIFPSTHPLAHKLDLLRRSFGSAEQNLAGAIGYHQTGGEYRIVVGGSEVPVVR